MTPQDLQLQYEQDSDVEAAATRLRALLDAGADGDVDAPRAQALIKRMYSIVQESLEEAMATKTRGRGGMYLALLRKIPSEMAAVIAMRVCIATCSKTWRGDSSATKQASLQALAMTIGRQYETEILIADAEAVNPLYIKKVTEQLKENASTNVGHIRRLYNVAYDRVMKGEMDGKLADGELLQLGKYGLQACIDAGIVEALPRAEGSKDMYRFALATDVEDYLLDYTAKDVAGVTSTDHLAMTCPPQPWTNLSDGGFLSGRRKLAFPLMAVKRMRKSERARIREAFTAEKMPKVFSAGNYLQSTAFVIHQPTLQHIVRVWEAGGKALGLPSKSRPVKPAFPFDSDTWIKEDATEAEMALFMKWKYEAVKFYEDERTWRSKNREIGGFMRQTAGKNGPLWFPMQMDSRGRWYYRGTPNPQGSDLAKASLHFHKKKPLGKRGLYWLRVSVANSFGFDKATFDVREQWTKDNWDDIVRGMDEPENCDLFEKADSPWCMYSACYEIRAALASGNPETYETGCPVHMDATCSGLQHFSAMLRDEVGGKYVNLTAEQHTVKQDIYSRVATNALAAMKKDLESSDAAVRAMAAWWIENGISRDMAKKPVMTYVYGATLLGTSEFVAGEVILKQGKVFPESEAGAHAYPMYCAKKLFRGIETTVPMAAAAMQMLKKTAGATPTGVRMEWTTPTGFLVQHDYQDYDEKRVPLRSCGVVSVLMRIHNDGTKKSKMMNAIAPNFVHALDGSHVTLTANSMSEHGLCMVSIHDSFGTHPCDVDMMHVIIRTQFVRMYKDDVLGNFQWEVSGVVDAPMRGNLNLLEVLQNEFFFC